MSYYVCGSCPNMLFHNPNDRIDKIFAFSEFDEHLRFICGLLIILNTGAEVMYGKREGRLDCVDFPRDEKIIGFSYLTEEKRGYLIALTFYSASKKEYILGLQTDFQCMSIPKDIDYNEDPNNREYFQLSRVKIQWQYDLQNAEELSKNISNFETIYGHTRKCYKDTFGYSRRKGFTTIIEERQNSQRNISIPLLYSNKKNNISVYAMIKGKADKKIPTDSAVDHLINLHFQFPYYKAIQNNIQQLQPLIVHAAWCVYKPERQSFTDPPPSLMWPTFH